MPARGDITTRIAVLEEHVDGIVSLFGVELAGIRRELSSNSRSTRWVLRTMIGILVAFVGSVALLLVKGHITW